MNTITRQYTSLYRAVKGVHPEWDAIDIVDYIYSSGILNGNNMKITTVSLFQRLVNKLIWSKI
jgi:hypothetical protein